MSKFESLSKCCSPSHLVAELIFFFFKIGEALLEPSLRLYIYQEVCSHEFPADTTCFHLQQFPDREELVQKNAATYLMVYKLILNLPAIFLGLFCGAWSDKVGRKLPIMLSSFGTIVAVIVYMLSMLTDEQGLSLLFLVLVGAAIRGAFGKSAVMTMALHSYVSDISDEKCRTQKLGKLLSMNYFGFFLGSLMAGVLLETFGFDLIFCLVIACNSLCVLLAVIFMNESVSSPSSSPSESPARSDSGTDIVKQDQSKPPSSGGISRSKKSKTPFRWKHVKESVGVIFRDRNNRKRFHIIFFFSVIFIQQMCKSGEVDITLLFAQKSPLLWKKSTYGYLLAVDYAALGLASAFLLPCLVHFIHLSDITLILLGCAFKAVRLVIMAFSTQTWMVFLSVIVGCPSALIISCAKSLISKTVKGDEMGKTFSLLSCGEIVSNLVGSILFTSIYTTTVGMFSGFTFCLDAGIFFLLFLTLILVAWDMKVTSEYDLLNNDVPSGDTVPTPASYGATDSGNQTALVGTPANTLHDKDLAATIFREENEKGGKVGKVEETPDKSTKHFRIDSESESENDNDDGRVLKEVRNK